jgi:allantoinase
MLSNLRLQAGKYVRGGVSYHSRSVSTLDAVVQNARVVRPDPKKPIQTLSLGVRDGKIVEMAESIDASRAENVYDAKGLMAFPGLVDAHMHVGIYQPLEEDAVNESKAAGNYSNR